MKPYTARNKLCGDWLLLNVDIADLTLMVSAIA
jgi:hypothetical protein